MTEGMINVLEAAVRNGVRRVVYTSSKAVYGVQPGVHRHPDYLPLAETATPNPVTMYGAQKLAGEHLGRIYRNRHGLEFAALRFASTVGPTKVQRHGAANAPGDMIERSMTGEPCRIEAGATRARTSSTTATRPAASSKRCMSSLRQPAPRSPARRSRSAPARDSLRSSPAIAGSTSHGRGTKSATSHRATRRAW